MATTDEEGVDVLSTSTGEKVKAGAAAETEYVILERSEDAAWSTIQGGSVKARSAEAAIRSLEAAGTYVAIPSRSWRPVTVKAEVVTTLKLEDAS